MFKKRLIGLLIPFVVLTSGCDIEGDGDNVSIENNFTNGGGNGGNGGSSSGSCDGVPTADFVEYNENCSIGTLSGVIDMNWTLTSDISWRLTGTVQVGDGNREVTSDADVTAIKDAGVTLTIDPGTHVQAFDTGSLLVTRGSRLIADGAAASPITFSSLDDNFDGLGEWGGIIIQGFAPQYGQGGTGACFGSGTFCNVEGEGGTDISVYGGNDPADNSGVLRYVRVAEGGLVAGPNNEINGITLQGVGHGTVLEYIQVHGNLDDAVEWFGGTVNLRYAVLTNNDDDDLDYDEGAMINVQNVLIRKHPNKQTPTGSNDPRAIEANSSDDEYTPETEAILANITIIGSDMNNAANSDAGPQPGMRLRGAVTTGIYNSSVSGFDEGCARIDDADVNGDGSIVIPSNITLTNVLGDCLNGIYNKRAADAETNVQAVGLSYDNNFAIEQGEAQLASATSIPAVNNGSGFVFDSTDYIGAVDPRADGAWWMGWTIPGTVSAPEAVVPADFVSCNAEQTQCTLSGLIDENYTLVAGVEWRLDGEVLVGRGNVEVASASDVEAIKAAGVTLTIRPGVHVRAFDTGSLLVTRGSKLWAVGTAQSPITFSSLGDDDFDGEGEWGGIVIQGFAPQYGQGGTGACFGSGTVCNVEGEGGTVVGNYGGNDPADNSGALRYVRIAEGGLVAGPNNEINGLTLQGVGHGTELSYIQVHGNLDDAVEWFGGTVNAKYLVLTNNDDDSLDVDEGYKGNIQHVIIRMNPNKSAPTGSNDPRGIEANSSDDEYVTETDVAFANILILGSDVNNNEGAGQQPGARLRGAITASLYNTAIAGFDTGCVRVDDADVNGDGSVVVSSHITLVNVIGDCEDGFYDKRVADIVSNAGAGTVTVDGAYALTGSAATVPATGIPAVDNGSGFTFDNTNYIGAVPPGTAAGDAWYADWIIAGSLD